jgi:hypothetical protein
MVSISELIIRNISSISESYTKNIAEPNQAMSQLGESLRKDGEFIKKFERIEPITDRSLIAVDGGNAREQLSGGDLIVTAATIGEGLSSRRIYPSPDDYPSEVYNNIVPHTSNNDKIEKAIRSAQELRILHKVPSDIKIIDGAYVGNISTVLYALLDRDPAVSNAVLELTNFDEDGLLDASMNAVLYPPRTNDNYIIAVPKSDSSTVYTKKLLEKYKLNITTTDRMLAGRLLHPGEFFEPRNADSNPGLISNLTKSVTFPGYGSKSSNRQLLDKMIQGKSGLLTRMGLANTEEGILWTTYFKPTAWSPGAKAIKIEFIFYPSDTAGTVLDKATELIQIIDQDIVNENILEPWCQYKADMSAKGVSEGINIVKNYLLSSVENPSELSGLIRGYRT